MMELVGRRKTLSKGLKQSEQNNVTKEFWIYKSSDAKTDNI